MELNKDETIYVAQHLIALHRQTVYNRRASVGEACESCPIRSKCFNNSSVSSPLWGNTYKNICKGAEIEYSFAIGEYPLASYEKEDTH